MKPDELHDQPVTDTECSCCSSELPGRRSGVAAGHFTGGTIDTPAGPVARARTDLGWRDHFGTLGARLGPTRNNYRVDPGLYGVGRPGEESPVLVTANYKLSFDAVRQHLGDLDAWLLVLDTNGVNVWCAAGKRTFSTQELVHRIAVTDLASVVSHRRLVLPQLGATGVSALDVKRESGFAVTWGPVRACDILEFLAGGLTATEDMRRVTFRLFERLVLIPVELYTLARYALWSVVAALLLSGLGPGFFSPGAAVHRGTALLAAGIAGVVAGAVLTPALLPWLPGLAFSIRGAFLGLIAGWITTGPVLGLSSSVEAAALLVLSVVIASFLAMNFTGATPFTSPSGVEKEMRMALPVQLTAGVGSLVIWVAAAFF